MSNHASNPIRIATTDLHAPEVDSYVELQNYLRRDVGPMSDQTWVIRIIYANWFYLSTCSMIGALVGWGIMEPWYDDFRDEFHISQILFFPVVCACTGLFLGAAEGIICRNPLRAVKSGVVSLGIGFVACFVVYLPAEMLFGFMSAIAISVADDIDEHGIPSGMGLLVLMMGRAAAWSVYATAAGVGQGIALRERKVVINGVVGALLGGLVGGLLFDPIAAFLRTQDNPGAVSRAVGFAAIGASVGLFVGLVEGWTKTAWLLMQKGPLAGKQFIMFKDTTVLGSSPKADVYLFKDDAIEPKHAIVTNRGGRFEIEDGKTRDGTYVNGIAITRAVLADGDQIVLGKTVLQFSMKEARSG